MSILQLIASDNFITVNKTLIKIVGLEAAVLLGELASEANYWEAEGGLEDGFFYSTIENIEEKTSLSVYQQKNALSILTQYNLVEVKRMGMPARRYIKINEEEVILLFTNKIVKNSQTRLLKTNEQDCEFFDTNKNINNNNRIKENTSYKETTKESFEDVMNSYPVIAQNEDIKAALFDYMEMRKKIKKPIVTNRALKVNINELLKLSKQDPSLTLAIIEQSIGHSWQGFYALKDTKETTGDYFTDLLNDLEVQTNGNGNFIEGVTSLPDTLPDVFQG